MINSAHRSSGASTSHPLRCSPPLVRTRRKLYNSLCQFSAFVVVLRGIPIELVNLQDSPSIYVRVTRHRMGAVIPSKYVCPAYFIVPVDVPLPNLELIPRACSHLIDLDGVPPPPIVFACTPWNPPVHHHLTGDTGARIFRW